MDNKDFIVSVDVPDQSEVNELRKWEFEDEQPVKQKSNQGMFEKLLNMFGFEAEIIEEEDEDNISYEEPYSKNPKERGKLLSITNSSKPVKMIIIEPSSFEEVQAIVDHLKNKRAVILNLEDTDKTVARRIADFLGGAIYALEGTMQRVSGSIFLFTPMHIEVSVPLRTELKDKDRDRDKDKERYYSTLFKSDRET